MRWIALQACIRTEPGTVSVMDEVTAQLSLSCLALSFTPRVALVDEAVLMEVAGSLRLFGGKRGRVRLEGRETRTHLRNRVRFGNRMHLRERVRFRLGQQSQLRHGNGCGTPPCHQDRCRLRKVGEVLWQCHLTLCCC